MTLREIFACENARIVDSRSDGGGHPKSCVLAENRILGLKRSEVEARKHPMEQPRGKVSNTLSS